MVKPDFLQSDDVVEWPGSIEPMWSHLEFESYCRLQRRPDEKDPAIQLATDNDRCVGRGLGGSASNQYVAIV
jgi:hypothetical protein